MTMALDDLKLHAKMKLSALWVSATLCYLYGDFIAFYVPGSLQKMLDGKMGPWQASQELLLGVAILMALPAVLVALTLLLRPDVSRWLNIVMGVAYTAIMLITMPGAWYFGAYFYLYLGVVEVVLTSLIVWYALTWPRQQVHAATC